MDRMDGWIEIKRSKRRGGFVELRARIRGGIRLFIHLSFVLDLSVLMGARLCCCSLRLLSAFQ